MSTRRLTTLLLVALLAINTFAIDADSVHKCTHGEHDNPEPEYMDIEEDYNPEGNDHSGRTLANYNNMKFYAIYSMNGQSSNFQNYVRTALMPPVMSYMGAALRVKYPVSGLWKTTAGNVCGVSTPSALRSGVSADFIYVVAADSSSSYVANTYTCNMASGTSRPLAGKTTISSRFVSATSDVLVHEKNMVCMIHELTHALGFATSMYGRFLNSAGRKLTGHILSATLDGASARVINVEPLTSRLRNHFGCSNLKGAYMENSGSSATAGSHFERKIFTYEVMTSGLINQQSVSEFTLALLEGSGWYVPDYSYADGWWFGKGKGCNFINQRCPSTQFSEYCNGGRQCANSGRGAGSCSSDTRADNCRWVIPSSSLDCDNSRASISRLGNVQTYGRGKRSKCFMGTLNTKSAGSNTNFCFTSSCSGSGANTRLTIKVGNTSAVCTRQGNISVSGYAGSITCPDPQTFCSTVGALKCPRNCMGRGSCVNGFCQCRSGFKGADCALPSNF